jgi:hypothetical protein
MKFNLVPHPQPLVKIQQIPAAAQQYMLAVIDDLGILAPGRPRRRASANERPRFVEVYLEPFASQGSGRGNPRQPATNDSYPRPSFD